MVRSCRMVLLSATALILVLLASCGGGSESLGDDSIKDIGDRVPEVQVQSVDHGYRVAGWSDLDLDPDPIFSLLGSARESLDIAVTRINRQEVVEALLVMASAGVQVRIVTEKAYYDDDLYKPFYSQLEDLARNRGNLEIHTDKEGLPRIMGSRFIVIDHSRVITGSYNWETPDSDHTFGDMITILNTEVAAAFTNQFNQMFVEGNFGAYKRDETQHSFLLGDASGISNVDNGILEVYFGPTNQLGLEIEKVLNESNEVYFMVQQFGSQEILGFFGNWLVAPSPIEGLTKKMVGIINDIGINADQQEFNVYQSLDFLRSAPEAAGSNLYLNTSIDPTGDFLNFDTLNHKILYGDGRLSGSPTVVFSTANYSNPDLSQNDEVILVFNGRPLARKFYRGTDQLNSRLPADVDEASDIEEFDQVMAMFPFLPNAGDDADDAAVLRNFSGLPCGVVFGTVPNFRESVNIQTVDGGEIEEVRIDLTFSVKGDLFFGRTVGQTDGADDPEAEVPVFLEDYDAFIREERLNPEHTFFMVVPAGDITLITTVTDPGGDISPRFEPDEKTFTIAPGGVRKLKLTINQQSSDGNSGI